MAVTEKKVVVIPEGKVCDYVDGKFRNDTPEEYVRQTIEKRLINEHKYAPSQVQIIFAVSAPVSSWQIAGGIVCRCRK